MLQILGFFAGQTPKHLHQVAARCGPLSVTDFGLEGMYRWEFFSWKIHMDCWFLWDSMGHMGLSMGVTPKWFRMENPTETWMMIWGYLNDLGNRLIWIVDRIHVFYWHGCGDAVDGCEILHHQKDCWNPINDGINQVQDLFHPTVSWSFFGDSDFVIVMDTLFDGCWCMDMDIDLWGYVWQETWNIADQGQSKDTVGKFSQRIGWFPVIVSSRSWKFYRKHLCFKATRCKNLTFPLVFFAGGEARWEFPPTR